MEKLLSWIQFVAVPALGPLGIGFVAFLDSSVLSLPEVNDLLVVSAAAAEPAWAWLYAASATVGSVLGAVVIWWLGHRGGEALLVRRFGEERVAGTRELFERWGGWSLAIPALLPPPAPFKIFLVAAGVFGYPLRSFVLVLTLARAVRYGAWATLGVVYQNEAQPMLRAIDAWGARNLPALALALTAAVLAVVGYRLWRRRSTLSAEAVD